MDAPEQWRWSSFRFYLLNEPGPVRVNEVRGGFRFTRGWREGVTQNLLLSAVGIPALRKMREEPALSAVEGTAHPLLWRVHEIKGRATRQSEPNRSLIRTDPNYIDNL
jgi:hypothetical protein